MLQLKNICKQYTTGDLVQTALDDVSLNFRDNEFVAILGPSGSGKTTLLNIIGGLDRYDSGDLIINGISTKQYSDRDWDSYRNHTIGFVFQSYNLIPHQTVLSNVELALTISGISREERRKRAKEALDQVGLGDQLHKKPNQMSGGQMQRVAIARALINNPDILLADEPTGALDSETSVQVMDLLKEVAKERMVVMVTHNPELAQQYATRIVRLTDGRIISDTDPYFVDDTALEPPVHKNMGHSAMTRLTALGLSFNNLGTKRGRTFLTAFAGSIGIIGIGLVLSVSAGVNDYIDTLEEETMSEYPIQVSSSGFDITSMMSSFMGSSSASDEETEEDQITVTEMISSMFSMMDTNDLESFKEYIDSGESDLDDYTKAIEYIYEVEPQIYLEDGDTIHQVNPESTLTSGFGLSSSLMSMMSSYMSMDLFYAMPENEELYIDSYEVKAGRWPEDYNECVLVLSSEGSVSDYMLYTLGLRDYEEYESLVEKAANGESIDVVEYLDTYSYDEVLGQTFKLVNASDYYEYDSEYSVWTDKTDNEDYMRELVQNGEDITIVGIVQPLEDATAAALTEGLNYPKSLIEHVAEEAAESQIVKDQISNPKINVFTGEAFGENAEFDLESLFSLDDETLSELFDADSISDLFSSSIDLSDLTDSSSMDLSALMGSDSMSMDLSDMDLNLDLSDLNLDLSDLDLDLSDMDLDLSDLELSGLDLSALMSDMDISDLFNVSSDSLNQLAEGLLTGYEAYAAENSAASYTDLTNDFLAYLSSSEAQQILSAAMSEIMEDAVSDALERQDITELLQDLAAAGSEGANDVLYAWMMDAMGGITISSDQMASLTAQLTAGYASYAAANQLTTAESISEDFMDYLSSDSAQQVLTAGIMEMLDTDLLETQINAAMQSYMSEMMSSVTDAIAGQIETQITAAMDQVTSQLESQMDGIMTQISAQIESQMTDVMSQVSAQLTTAIESSMEEMLDGISDSMLDSLDIDAESIMESVSTNMDADSLLELMTSMSTAASSSYSGNLADLGYVDFDSPSEIDIYPKDFESKDGVVAVLDNYNAEMLDAGEVEKQITYTDLVGTMMSTVTTIINLVSYVLIAFVSVSLIVSSIMIGIITYISVLERTREIGILRAIGASKRNIAQIFNSETFIVGLCAGLLGVGIALLLLIPINMVVHNFVQADGARAYLPVSYSIMLVLLSVVLTLIGGLIPSRKASTMDPVSALRSE
ncbi:MAG: ATP-binding cassette domain-containing protein [Clostridiales bacterium]|nr:ATP-binding cassette domain-containing protein [Clostridiales bacterium]